jgi:hypothetical protein
MTVIEIIILINEKFFSGLIGLLWLIEMNSPNFISSPRGKSKSGYGGFVYLIFAIGGVAPKVVFYPQENWWLWLG